MSEPERFETHARNVALLTLVSRATGLVRDATLSRLFGAGVVMDAFFFAFMIPNLFRRLFGEGALAAAFLPVYARLERDDRAAARALASLTVSGLIVVLGLLVVASEAGLLLLADRAEHSSLSLRLTMIMLPYMPLVCTVAILGAMLQVHGRFGPTAAAPIVLNLAMIAAAIGAAVLWPGQARGRPAAVAAVAVAVVVAGVLQLAWSLWALREDRWWAPWRDRARAAKPMRQMLAQALPMIVGLGVLQLNTFFDGLIASYPSTIGPRVFGIDYPLTEGAMSAISYAQRLYQFPLGVFGIAVATAIFPSLVRQWSTPKRFTDVLQRGLRLVVFIGLPASAGLILVRDLLVSAILEGGAFTAADAGTVSFVLFGYAASVWAYSMVQVLTRAFYATGDTRTPVGVAVRVVVLNLLLNVTLIWTPLREAGLAWSTAICAVVQVALLLRRLRGTIGPLLDRSVLSSWAKSLACTLAMLFVVALFAVGLPRPEGWFATLLQLLFAVGVGGAVVALVAILLRMPELRWALGRAAAEVS